MFGTPQRPPDTNGEPRKYKYPLVRVAGLYPSRDNKWLRGSVDPSRQGRGGTESVGERLVQLIETAVEQQMKVQFFVYEADTARFPNAAPYNLSVGLVEPQQEQPGGQPFPEDRAKGPNESEVDEPTPQPRPTRRTAPRR